MRFPDLERVQAEMKVRFREPQLLQQALVHSSFINEAPSSTLRSNETLEFLGDAAIGLIIAQKLYNDYPNLNEGHLTNLRASLVRTQTLAEIGRTLRLGEYLILGRGEEAGGGRDKARNLAAAFEAIVGAVLLDGGLAKARAFVLRCMRGHLSGLATTRSLDAKSRLQQLAQERWQRTPGYRLLSTKGPDHAKTFEIAVEVDNKVLGIGTGRSKKEAEQRAASEALAALETP
jgi:ribonuclease-3